MSFIKTVFPKFTVLLLLSFPPFSFCAADNPSDHDKITIIIGLAKFADQIESISEMTKTQSQKYIKTLQPEIAEKFAKTIEDSYSRINLIPVFSNSFRKNLNSNSISEVLKWLESDLGKKITTEEIAALTAENAASFKPTAFTSLPDERKKLVAKLIAAISAESFNEKIASEPIKAMMESQQNALPPKMKQKKEELDKKIEEMQKDAQKDYSTAIPSSIAFIYRNLTNEEFSKMIEFFESPAGKNFNSAVQTALLAALNSASAETGRGQASIIMLEISSLQNFCAN